MFKKVFFSSICFFSVFVPGVLVLAAPLYVYTDSSGVTHFTSKKPPADVKSKVFTSKSGGYSRYKTILRSNAKLYTTLYNNYIAEAANKYGVGGALIKAVIHVESAFNFRAVSKKGAMGLMQLMPSTCQRFNVKNPFSPQDNINGGVQFLAFLLKKYKGNLSLVLAAYNSGERNVEKYNGVPPFAETKDYIKKVLLLRKQYQEQL